MIDIFIWCNQLLFQYLIASMYPYLKIFTPCKKIESTEFRNDRFLKGRRYWFNPHPFHKFDKTIVETPVFQKAIPLGQF